MCSCWDPGVASKYHLLFSGLDDGFAIIGIDMYVFVFERSRECYCSNDFLGRLSGAFKVLLFFKSFWKKSSQVSIHKNTKTVCGSKHSCLDVRWARTATQRSSACWWRTMQT